MAEHDHILVVHARQLRPVDVLHDKAVTGPVGFVALHLVHRVELAVGVGRRVRAGAFLGQQRGFLVEGVGAHGKERILGGFPLGHEALGHGHGARVARLVELAGRRDGGAGNAEAAVLVVFHGLDRVAVVEVRPRQIKEAGHGPGQGGEPVLGVVDGGQVEQGFPARAAQRLLDGEGVGAGLTQRLGGVVRHGLALGFEGAAAFGQVVAEPVHLVGAVGGDEQAVEPRLRFPELVLRVGVGVVPHAPGAVGALVLDFLHR